MVEDFIHLILVIVTQFSNLMNKGEKYFIFLLSTHNSMYK